MELKTTLDIDLVAVETADEVAVLHRSRRAARRGVEAAPHALQIVIDRSASMAGVRLDAAEQALGALVACLDPSDVFGLVAFDDEVRIAVPAAPFADKPATVAAIRALEPGGMTNLGRLPARTVGGATRRCCC